uniref:Uncharacterized protein n=1 Tax=Octopus bimaculoides TaxID=37653 RepID=A0A0L8G025_OCTBM
MKAHCCKGFTKKDNLCISITTPAPSTTTMPTTKTFFEIHTSGRIRIDGGPLFTDAAYSGTTKSSLWNQTVTTTYSECHYILPVAILDHVLLVAVFV